MITLDKIIEINECIDKLKVLNKEFSFEIGEKLIMNFKITNKIISEENSKLADLVSKYGDFDGYDYVIPEQNSEEYLKSFKSFYEKTFDENEIGLVLLKRDDVLNSTFDLTTTELLLKMI